MIGRAVVGSLLVAVLFAVMASGPAIADDGGDVTSVDADGDVVTITVPIDLVPGSPEIARRLRDIARRWEEAAETYWNNAFEFLSYKCFNLRLDVKFKLRREGFEGSDKRHRVIVSSGGGGTPGFEGTKERNPTAGSRDGTRSFDSARDGIWREDQPDSVTAHEAGHLFGLGDDYEVVSEEPRRTRPKPGRGDTLMGDGGLIDQALVNRVGDQLAKTADLPECWEGTITGPVQFPNCSPATLTGSLSVVVKRNGSVTGQFAAAVSATNCGGAGVPAVNVEYKVVDGHKTGNRMELEFNEGSTATLVVRSGRATGRVERDQSGSEFVYLGNAGRTQRVELTRTSR